MNAGSDTEICVSSLDESGIEGSGDDVSGPAWKAWIGRIGAAGPVSPGADVSAFEFEFGFEFEEFSGDPIDEPLDEGSDDPFDEDDALDKESDDPFVDPSDDPSDDVLALSVDEFCEGLSGAALRELGP
jgi:hypothetical protein